MYGLIMAVSVTFTILCVTIQRRHLMVYWHNNSYNGLDFLHSQKTILEDACVCVCGSLFMCVICLLSNTIRYNSCSKSQSRYGVYLRLNSFLMWWVLFSPTSSSAWHPCTILYRYVFCTKMPNSTFTSSCWAHFHVSCYSEVGHLLCLINYGVGRISHRSFKESEREDGEKVSRLLEWLLCYLSGQM